MQEISALPGRIRFRNPSLYYNKALTKYINAYTDNLNGVKYCTANHATASILVVYDPLKTDGPSLRKNIEIAVSYALQNRPENIRDYDEYYKTLEKRDKAKRNMMLFGLIYLGLKIKNSFYGKFTFSTHTGVLQAAAAVTVIGGYPLLKGIYKKLAKNLPTESDILLSLAALSFTLLRESSKGVLLLLLKAMNDYIKYSADAQCQRMLNQSMNKTQETALPERENRPFAGKEKMLLHRKVSRYQEVITPVSLGAGAVSYLTSGNIMNAFAVLLALTPSGAGTALSTGMKSYVSLLNKHRIFIRRPEAFEKVICADYVVFDKAVLVGTGANPGVVPGLPDNLKEGAVELVRQLEQKWNYRTVLMTGDNRYEAGDIGRKLGIDLVHCNCGHEEKVEIIRGYKSSGIVIMVGDGIHDTGAMREADVSVSIACSACDAVKLDSDYILFDDSMGKLSDMISLSHKAYSRIHQSIRFSQLYNLLFGGLAVAGRLDAFAAKSINTVNSIAALLLNKRIEYLGPGGADIEKGDFHRQVIAHARHTQRTTQA